MDLARKPATPEFVTSVAELGAQLSDALYNKAILDDNTFHKLPRLIGDLRATVHCLNQLCSLLKREDSSLSLLNDGGLKYVEILVEEISVVIHRIQWTLVDENYLKDGNTAKFWKSFVSTDELGRKEISPPDLDEIALFRGSRGSEGLGGCFIHSALLVPMRRLEYLHSLLLLVVQVVTVKDMTNKLPSGTVDLALIIEYHRRIVRVAQKIRLASTAGSARRAGSYLSSFSWTSDSESNSDSDSDSSSISFVRRGPRPPPPGWKSFVPPKALNPNETAGMNANDDPSTVTIPPPTALCPSLLSSISSPRLVEIKEETYKSCQNPNPPSYSEKDGVIESTVVLPEISSTTQQFPLEMPEQVQERSEIHIQDKARTHDNEKKSLSSESKDGSAKTPALGRPKTALDNNDRLLDPQASGFGLKLKSLFRSKSSLEAEMKRTLSATNACLKAFIVQHRELRKVPHSAFHSLEYTHMRTILSQLKDNTWFKTFSDLTDAEHDAMENLMRKYPMDGKWFQRELVVLKILQENKYNAWMRVMEDCMGIEWGKPHHENYRIILAIVREKECDAEPQFVSSPSTKVAKAVDYYDAPPLPRIPEPLPTMKGDQMLVDLDNPGPSRLEPAVPRVSPSWISPPVGRGPPPPPPPGWVGPAPSARGLPPPPPPPGWLGPPPMPLPNNDKGVLSPSGEVQLGHSEVMPNNPVSADAAREALTSYEAFTFRPALQQKSPLGPLVDLPPRTWSRCFITREREETKVLLERMEKFRRSGFSIIDLKVQLSEPQAAQLTNLVQELNQMENDKRFEHKMVELSMFDREHGLVMKQPVNTSVDVIHIIIQRAPKQGVNPQTTYNLLMKSKSITPRAPPPAPRGPPPPPPPPQWKDEDIIIIEDIPRRNKNRTRSIASSSYLGSSSGSDSESTNYTVTTASSGGYRRRRPKRKGSRYRRFGYEHSSSESENDSEFEEEQKARWKVDPVTINFNKKEKGKDVVQLLLEKWTHFGDGKGKVKEEDEETQKDAREKAKEQRKWRNKRKV